MATLYFRKHRGLSIALLSLLSLFVLAPQAAKAGSPSRHARVKPAVFEGTHIELPLLQLGFEVITEGTANYTVHRTMRNSFPFDTDLTIIAAWGYTGDKLTMQITDQGDKGDRLFACATAVVNGESTTEWGTMFSSASQSSFMVTVPMDSPGGIVYLLSGYFPPSLGDEPYSYTITFMFPQ